ncbi:MAG: hypothetical protein Q8M94_13350 [Ignavibacteria bacterium]|nr:hypothetical protein [Ignavibacteria bacterium]
MLKLNYRSIFYLIILMALVIRIYFVFFTNFSWYGCDSEMYLKMGKAIIDGEPISYFPNGYPLLVALTTLFFGNYTPTVLMIINIAAQILTLFIAEKILAQFELEGKVKLIVIVLIAFYPTQLSGVRFIMTEPLSVLIIMLSIYLFFTKKYSLFGFTSYLAYSFRPSLILFVPIVIIYQLYKGSKSSAGKMALGFATGIALFVLTDIAGLTASSGNQTQNILVSVQSYGYNINHSFSNYSPEQIEHPVKTYLNFAVSNPLEFLEQRVLSFWSLWGPYVPSQLGVIAMILHGLRFPFFIIALFTFFFRNRIEDKKDFIFILFIPVLSITLIHILFFSTQRHQFTAEPFVLILSVFGVEYVWNKIKVGSEQ